MELTYLIKIYKPDDFNKENKPLYDKPVYVILKDGRLVSQTIATNEQEVIDNSINFGFVIVEKGIYDEANALLDIPNWVLYKSSDQVNGTPMTLAGIRAMESTGHLKEYRVLHIKHKVGNNIRLDTILIDEDYTGSAEQPFAAGTDVLEIMGDR